MTGKQPPLRPTVMGDVRRKPQTHLTPTQMPGTTPQRFTPDLAALQGLMPDAAPTVVQAAQAQLARLIAAHINHKTALFWGQDLQEAHRDLMQDRLALTRSPLLHETAAHLTRLRDLLARIDIQAVAQPGGMALQTFRRVTRLVDTAKDLTAARGEIDMLVQLLTRALDGLLTLRTGLATHATLLATMADQVEAAALAAAWLAHNAAPDHRRSFADRGHSLRATLLQINAARLQLINDQAMPDRLILAIQNIALVALPAWLDRVAQLQRRPSLTEAREVAFRLNDLFPLFPSME